MTARTESRRDSVAIAVEVADAARALNNVADGWRTFLPRRGAITDAQNCAEGLRRALADLALAMEGERHG